MARLISFSSSRSSWVSFSMSIVACCSAMIWSFTSRRADDHFCLRFSASSTHSRLVWLPSQERMKSLRGMRAVTVARFSTRRSCDLMSAMVSRSCLVSTSVSGSGSFRVTNTADISSRRRGRFFLSPLVAAFLNALKASLSACMRAATSSGSGPVGAASSSPPSTSSSSSSSPSASASLLSSAATAGGAGSSSTRSLNPTITSARRFLPSLWAS